MKLTESGLILSAMDLANHIACPYLTHLDLRAANGELDVPIYRDPIQIIMQERGIEFEKSYLTHIKEKGLKISEPKDDDTASSIERTIEAMASGVDFIYQATLKKGNWQGRADFLKKVPRPSALGDWSYEVMDSKLSRDTKGGTILQLCLYSQMVEEIQKISPEYFHVIIPEDGFREEAYRLNDFIAFCRFSQNRLEAAIAKGTDKGDLYPHPVSQCDICRWWQHCEAKRRSDDHLSLVAGLGNTHAAEMKKWGIETVENLAETPLPFPHKPSRGAVDTYIKLREQARVQVEARKNGSPVYEILQQVEGKGFFKLPVPSDGDIFFDLEGDPFVGTGGAEYLFGWATKGNAGIDYNSLWALNENEEKKAFEDFVDMVMARWKTYPDLHIYHFTPYEPSALKRLMGRYGTKENEIDMMLRAGLFIDLYSVTRQALRAGVERYSLKELEIFYKFERSLQLREAALQIKALQSLLARNKTTEIPDEIKQAVEFYNREDCLSTKSLRDWLEDLLARLIQDGHAVSRPETQSGEASEALTEHQQRILALYNRLAGDVSLVATERDSLQQARWILANMLDWYRREKKATWWEYFRLRDLPDSELIEEKAGLAFLQFTGTRRPEKKSVIDTYSFPTQECDLRDGDSLKTGNGDTLGEVISIDTVKGIIEIKKGPKNAEVHASSVFKHNLVPDEIKEEAIIRIATWIADNGMDSDGRYRATQDLLMALPPRTDKPFESDEPSQQKAVEWVTRLNNGILPIQGPPGAGKSHTAAQMIINLVSSGKRVGITALSHKVIKALLSKIVTAGNEKNLNITCVQKVSALTGSGNQQIVEVKGNDEVLVMLQSGQAQVAAGTAWLWSRPEFLESVDVLFVDEAGQLSLIDTIAVSQSAKNIVLLGDPQQLKQPQQGTHPEGTDVSALEHILGRHKTIPKELGIFLDETWRLNPKICSFISELFYEDRLHPRPNLKFQVLSGETQFKGAGIWYVPVDHDGNQSSSQEEVRAIASIVGELTTGRVNWTNDKNETRPITIDDIMVIAPYNAQVVALQAALPNGTHVGTVDKFQGQEAPVVIFSMSTSSPEDAPRGMEFLYSLNRLNVAVSRARGAHILVASPKLFEPDCKNPSQMRLANAFCRYLELIEN